MPLQLQTNPNTGNMSSNPPPPPPPSPPRRRSRTLMGKTPTTTTILLEANTTNFRALVQQFAGCRSVTLSFETHGGPLKNSNSALESDLHATNSVVTSLGNNYYHQPDDQHQPPQQLQQKQQQKPIQQPDQKTITYQQQQHYNCMFDTNNITAAGDVIIPTPNMQTLEDFLMENICLYELIGDSYSHDEYMC